MTQRGPAHGALDNPPGGGRGGTRGAGTAAGTRQAGWGFWVPGKPRAVSQSRPQGGGKRIDLSCGQRPRKVLDTGLLAARLREGLGQAGTSAAGCSGGPALL